MRITLSIPDAVAQRFQASVPARQRSKLVTRLIEDELKKEDAALAKACMNANQDTALESEIDEWQAFEDPIAE
jgi:hypothetical protein